MKFIVILAFSCLTLLSFGQPSGGSGDQSEGKWIYHGKNQPNYVEYFQNGIPVHSDQENTVGSHRSILVTNGDSINSLDEDGRKAGYWEYRGKDRPEAGYCDTCLIEKGNYKSGRKEGQWERFYPNGKIKFRGTYHNNRPTGILEKYDLAGNKSVRNMNIRSTGNYWNRTKHLGLTQTYYSSGCMKYLAYYNNNGQEDSTVTYFHDNCSGESKRGQIEFIYVAKNGVPVDTAYRYYPSGDLKELIVFSDGGRVFFKEQFNAQEEEIRFAPEYDTIVHPDQSVTIKNKAGQTLFEGTLKDDERWMGKVYKYDSDGILFQVDIWREGKYVYVPIK